jgi:hypothetical protein
MDSDQEREVGIQLRTTQITVAALILGVLSLYGVAVFLLLTNVMGPIGVAPRQESSAVTPRAEEAPKTTPSTGPAGAGLTGIPLPAIGCVLAAVTTVLSFVVKGLILRRVRQDAQGAADAMGVLLQRFRSANIVAGALCEGGAFAVGIFVMAAGPGNLPWLAGGLISFLGFAIHFPTREKLDAFLAESRS